MWCAQSLCLQPKQAVREEYSGPLWLLPALPATVAGLGLTSPGGPAGRCFRLDTRLRRIRRKDWRRDFFRDFTRDSGPSKASWSLGCSVHLGGTSGCERCQGPKVLSPGTNPRPWPPGAGCSLDKDLPPLLVVKEAKAVAGAKGHEPPLRVQSQGCDHSRGLALHQHEGLEAGLKAHRSWAGTQALVPLPAVALLVLQQVGLHLLHGMLRLLVIQLQHQHLEKGRWQMD